MTHEEAKELADHYRAAVAQRTGLRGDRLVCPREKSAMTPCLARDGGLVVVLASADDPICVGCEAHLIALVTTELAK